MADIQLDHVFQNVKRSSTLSINEAVAARWATGKPVLHLGFGESRFAVHPKIKQAMVDAAGESSYLPVRGLPVLRDAVANYYSVKLGRTFRSGQVMIGPGSKALIYALQQVTDTHTVLVAPAWVSYEPQARLLKKELSILVTEAASGYQFSIDELDQLLAKTGRRQKLLIINSPNNPTGQMYSGGFLKELADYCRKKNVLVISDEIYFAVTHGDISHTSISKYYPEGTFILGGLSKQLSLGGWRLGVAIMPDSESGRAVMDAVSVVASETWSAVASPIQYAALVAYSGDADVENYIRQCVDIHGIRTRYLRQHLTKLGIRCSESHGAFYLVADFGAFGEPLAQIGIKTSAQLACHLLESYGLATLSLDSFGMPENVLALRLATSYLDMETSADSERLLALHGADVSAAVFMSAEHHPNMNAAIGAFREALEFRNLRTD